MKLYKVLRAIGRGAAIAAEFTPAGAALAKPKVKNWQPFVFVVAIVCAAIIGLFALPYLAMWLTPPKGC